MKPEQKRTQALDRMHSSSMTYLFKKSIWYLPPNKTLVKELSKRSNTWFVISGERKGKKLQTAILNLHWCLLTTYQSLWVVSKKWIKTLCQSCLCWQFLRGMLHLWSLTGSYIFQKNHPLYILWLQFWPIFQQSLLALAHFSWERMKAGAQLNK